MSNSFTPVKKSTLLENKSLFNKISFHFNWIISLVSERKMHLLILSLVILLSTLAGIAGVAKGSLVGLLHLIQVILPVISGTSLIFVNKKLGKNRWYFIVSLFLLSASDALFYLLMYFLKLPNSSPLMEFLTIVPYLVVYILGLIPLWLNFGKHVLKAPLQQILICLIVPLLLWAPTLTEIIRSGKEVSFLIVIFQSSILYILLTVSLFSLIISKNVYWNTLSLGLFCLGLTDLSIMIEHYLNTVAIQSINTYLWTLASLAYSLPFLSKDFSNSNEVFFSQDNSLVLKSRLWLIAGVTIPVSLFSILGKGYQVMSFTSITILLTTVIVYVITNEFLKNLDFISMILKDISEHHMQPEALEKVPIELKHGILNIFFENIRLKNQEIDAERLRVRDISLLADQISHDIRSPLSALNSITGTLDNIPELKRLIIRNATTRINDIANGLLKKGKIKSSDSRGNEEHDDICKPTLIMLSTVVDYIVSEKRVQYMDMMNIQIETNLSLSYGLFSLVNPNELGRVISNLINNSVEAFEKNNGLIKLVVRTENNYNLISLKDNGKGIPSHIISKLGEYGITFGKENTSSGSGLGIFHAKKTIESFGGKFEIISVLGEGTEIKISFPMEQPPDWFTNELKLEYNQNIIICDDDASIHNLWSSKFISEKLIEANINEIHFTSGEAIKNWFTDQKNIQTINTFLMDYELIGCSQTGLEIIEELGIGKRSILVTSRFEDPKVKQKCEELGVKLIPKNIVDLVKIVINKQKTKFDFCLIDDDSLIRTTWDFVSKEKGRSLITFSSEYEFINKHSEITFDTPIYIDVNLGNGVSGQQVAENLHKLGYENINLATGYESSSVEKPIFVKEIIGKSPPF